MLVQSMHAKRAAQAFSIFFQLLNMVEENAAVQMRRRKESAGGLDGGSPVLGTTRGHARHGARRRRGRGRTERVWRDIRRTARSDGR